MRIGLETHIQLNTNSKMFCSCKTPNKNAGPNTFTCPICLGLPGSKPAVNKEAIKKAIMTALALNCSINERSIFARKTYFYPDMGKNFQITQYDMPLAINGFLEVDGNRINISRVHLEEDPAKLMHKRDVNGDNYTLMDYNRSGIPLIEIVTKTDFESSNHAKHFLEKLQIIAEYLDAMITDEIKTDANVSVEGGERIEIKNINSATDVQNAIDYEINAQKKSPAKKQETKRWDDIKKRTVSMREKETEEDYGYIVEPDLTIIEISQKDIEELRKKLPELPDKKQQRLEKQYKLPKQKVVILTSEKEFADLFEMNPSEFNLDWIIKDLKGELNYRTLKLKDAKIGLTDLIELSRKIESKQITRLAGKDRLREMLDNKTVKIEAEVIGDITEIVRKVIEANPNAVKDYKKGKENALNFLIGETSKIFKKKADATIIRKELMKQVKK